MKAEWTNSDSLTTSQTTKAILVIDMPKSCAECLFCGWGGRNLDKYVCSLTKEHSEEPHLVGCPLKPMPEKLQFQEPFNDDYTVSWASRLGFVDGWNACLEEIEK